MNLMNQKHVMNSLAKLDEVEAMHMKMNMDCRFTKKLTKVQHIRRTMNMQHIG